MISSFFLLLLSYKFPIICVICFVLLVAYIRSTNRVIELIEQRNRLERIRINETYIKDKIREKFNKG